MSDAEDAREADFKEASSRLNEGLKTCRAVVENYRAALSGHPLDGEGPDASETAPDEDLPNPVIGSGGFQNSA